VTEPGTEHGGAGYHVRIGSSRTITVSEDRVDQVRRIARIIIREPFQRRTWSELAFFLVSACVGFIGVAFIVFTMGAGIFLAPIFIGLLVIAGSLRGTRGIGSWQRALAQHFLGERIGDPGPFRPRPGFFGWLWAALTDTVAWRALGYAIVKIPLVIFGVWIGLSLWLQAIACLLYPLASGTGPVHGVGIIHSRFTLSHATPAATGPLHPALVFVYGAILFLIAPWAMRLVLYPDRLLLRLLLGPDAMTARVRSLEQSRAQTVDASAATLRRIERNLHDGTQAELVAIAMRLGQAKEKLADEGQLDLEQIRRLVDEAHQGAKDAIVELRDLARGIHPPALDTGLESALTTLTSRAAIPSELSVSIQSRPSPAIEAIAYFCVAELLANVAQHAQASRASVSCAQHGPWLRIVVRDDGRGGAVLNRVGSSSSGLAGLTDRVRAVDGHLSIASPVGGPTVVTVDLPCQT
jgi:signal transduction histidine kinase